MNNQQGPTVQHKELCPTLCGSLDGRGVWERTIHAYVWLSPFTVHLKLPQHCSSAIPQYKIKVLKKFLPHVVWLFRSTQQFQLRYNLDFPAQNMWCSNVSAMNPQTLQNGKKQAHSQALRFIQRLSLRVAKSHKPQVWVTSYKQCMPTATTHKWFSILNFLYSHIHVTEAQFAIEVFPNITAKPYSLETEEGGRQYVNICPIFLLHQRFGRRGFNSVCRRHRNNTNLSIFDGGSNHLFQEVNGLVVIQSFSPSDHIA